MDLGHKERQMAIISAILKHRPFNETLKVYLRCGETPDANTIVQIMKTSNLYRVEADSTYFRRSSTILGWINWILGLVDKS